MDVALSPDGRGASVHATGQVAVLDFAKHWVHWTRLALRENNASASANQNRSAGPQVVAFSPDGRTLAVGCAAHRARRWVMASGRQELALDHGAWIRGIAFSPSGQLIATVGDDHTARLWELPSGVPYGACPSHLGSNQALAFAADGGTIAVAGHDRAFAVSIW